MLDYGWEDLLCLQNYCIECARLKEKAGENTIVSARDIKAYIAKEMQLLK
jgi:hypothetical protein